MTSSIPEDDRMVTTRSASKKRAYNREYMRRVRAEKRAKMWAEFQTEKSRRAEDGADE